MTQELVAIYITIGFFVALFIGVYILYLYHIYTLLKEIAPENAQITPGQTFIVLIPIVGFVYAFILYAKLSESLYEEFSARDLNLQGDFGKSVGLGIAICNVCYLIPFIGGISSFVGLVLIIIHWTKVLNFRRVLRDTSFGIGSRSTLD